MSPVMQFLTGSAPSPWTAEIFLMFIESLGDSQKCILALLIQDHRITDEKLRRALKLDSNQQLAGVLSGESKQAAAHNIPARAVYFIENESKSGETTKTYVAAMDFLRMAQERNWPAE